MGIIDWSQIKTVDDVLRLDEHLLYDEAEVLSPTMALRLNPNLTEDEIADAQLWANYTRGLMLVTGEPGAGKGVFSHMLSYKMHHYFGKLAVLDTRPRKSFGNYIPFGEEMIAEQITRMSLLEQGVGWVTPDGKWLTEKGEIFVRNSVVMLDEFGSKYMSRLSSPTLSIKQVLLKLFNFWRHMHCLMLGIGVSLGDFDRKCLDKAIWQAKCVRVFDTDEQEDNPDVIIIGVYLTPIKYNPFDDEISRAGDTVMLRINASEPKHMLNGLAWKDIFVSENCQGFELPSKMQPRRRKQ